MSADEPGRRIVVVRHGITEHNTRGIWQGHLDSELSETGLEQARQMAPVVADYAPDVVVYSDLRRAADTAQIILDALPASPVVRSDERLREIHCGQWQGLETAEMIERFPDAYTRLAGAVDFRRGEDGETYAELADRVGEAVADLIVELGPGRCGMVVAHGVVARALVGDLVGMSRETSWVTLGTLGNCHWAELVQAGDHWRLQRWNAGAVVTAAVHVTSASGTRPR